MNWEAISAISELISSVAVVCSLIYLAIQIKQSNILSQGQTRGAMAQSVQQEIGMIIDHPEILESFTKEELSKTEKIRLNEWLIACTKQREYEWNQYHCGVLDKESYESNSKILPIVLGTERTAQWWHQNKKTGTYSPAFVEFVEDLLKKQPKTQFFDFVQDL